MGGALGSTATARGLQVLHGLFPAVPSEGAS